ncbi:CBY1-interacting BAR domain-containing protein 1 isoform X2 [Syngnathoides biaculeatus]|uniref:CBY1-interacting BAR domain-containing protein 1 isoform X2 n=1 Tax=Syngnathoides biaculeatus TaxID=300417 RepID=UPI002ADDBA34|nr:CBY1-interacting BAR domain-containing protein 1 isoform X2 [Syngnathoides biaculeatus]XP_061680564.1 CBY1-interacting BAR domain-containing protein 1 isoform X2 [Syngnathoides biaculeatus]
MSTTPDARARDEQTKRIQESIGHVEKHFGDLCNMFGDYARKVAKLRDKADVLVRGVADYADTETPGLKKGVKRFAEQLAKIQDYRQAEVERLEAKVIKPLKGYSAVVQRKREDVKAAESARMRGTKQMLQLERTRQRNPADRQVISLVRRLPRFHPLMYADDRDAALVCVRPRASYSGPPSTRRGPRASWRRPWTTLRSRRFETSRGSCATLLAWRCPSTPKPWNSSRWPTRASRA